MAFSEDQCWTILRMIRGSSVAEAWLKTGGKSNEGPRFQNAIPLQLVERELVLRHTQTEIEGSLYFLQKRGYIVQHGTKGLTLVVLQLSEEALRLLEKGSFSQNEQQAFNEQMFDVSKPGMYGMSIRPLEWWRRLKKKWF